MARNPDGAMWARVADTRLAIVDYHSIHGGFYSVPVRLPAGLVGEIVPIMTFDDVERATLDGGEFVEFVIPVTLTRAALNDLFDADTFLGTEPAPGQMMTVTIWRGYLDGVSEYARAYLGQSADSDESGFLG